MTLSIASQTAIVNQLNDYCFKNIWNAVHAEYCVNVKLDLIMVRFATGFILGQNSIALPTSTDQYAIYIAPIKIFRGGLPLPQGRWFSGDDLITELQILTNVYPQSGIVLPKATTFFYIQQDKLYVACLASAVTTCIGWTAYQQLYVSIYRSTANAQAITCNSYFINSSNIYTTMVGAINSNIASSLVQNTPGTIVTINGIEVDATKTLTFVVGDYVDVITDLNVISGYSVNVSNGTTGYFSTKYQRYKEIIHTPISLNPNNVVITNNTCTFHVRSNTVNKGVYLHRNDPTGVTQITHNDFGIATTVIDAHRNDLNDQNVSVYVRIRTMGEHNILLNDAHFTNILYTFSDAIIMSFLTATNVDTALSFWSAASLEADGYVSLMFRTPSISDPTLLSSYATTLGYYTVASILSAHIQSVNVTDSTLNPMIFKKGYAFIGAPTYPLVYINGLKINSANVLHVDTRRDDIYIEIGDSVNRTNNDTFTISLIPYGPSAPYVFSPSAQTASITLPFQGCDVSVYRINTLTTSLEGYNATSSESFTIIPQTPGTIATYMATDGPGIEVVFGMSLYGQTFLIKPVTYVKEYSWVIDTTLENNLPLVFTLDETAANDSSQTPTPYPLLGYCTLEVFLNSKYLIPNIDYTCIPLNDSNGNPGLVQIVICNKEYLDVGNTGNVVEVIAHSSPTIQSESGYAYNGMISYDDNVNFLYPGLTAVYSHGLLKLGAVDNGNYITIPTNPPATGNPYYLQTTITNRVAEVLAPYVNTINQSWIQAVNSYYYETVPINTSTIIVPRSYELYSPYVQAVIYDVVNQNFIPACDPNDTTFLQQFSGYDYLMTRDPTVSTNSSIDRIYADVFPDYSGEVEVSLLDMYNILHRFTCLVMPPDSNTLGEIINA